MARGNPGSSSGPLEVFCSKLRRLQKASGVTQVQLARAALLSPSSMSDILNGRIKRPPDWDVTAAVVRTCLQYAQRTGRPLPLDLSDQETWRLRHHDLVQDLEVSQPEARQAGQAFATLLRQTRIGAGLTQYELAKAAMVSPRSISDLERGVSTTARKSTAGLLADALHLVGAQRELFEAAARVGYYFPPSEPDPGSVQDDEKVNLLLRIYIPSERLYAAEADRLLSLFRDWLMTTRGHGVRQAGYRTPSGQMYEFFADRSINKEDLREEFDNFSNFLTLCSADPSAAAETIGLGRVASTDFVARFGRKVRRLQIDLAHERERRILTIRHNLEEELVDSGVELGAVPSTQLNALIEKLVPGPSASNSVALLAAPESVQSAAPLVLNINQQYIRAVESSIIQNIQGIVHLSPNAKEFLALIDRFGGKEVPLLRAAVHELEDPDARPTDRSAAKRRLKKFLSHVAGLAHDVSLDLLEKYLESKMGM
jgi:transcriptional regulator with XRE-family HTH domain